MPDVEKAIRLWRETGYDAIDNTGIQITLNLSPQEITAWFCVHGRPLM
jgi:hypothetical protein